MPRDSNVYLDDILRAIAKIQSYSADMSSEALTNDEKTLDAVVRNLEIIGEAAKNVPDAFKEEHPEIDWKRMAGLRDILIHQYFGIDVEIISDILRNKLPILEKQIQKIVK